MKRKPRTGLRIILTAVGYGLVAWWLSGFVRRPPQRLLDRVLNVDTLRVEHAVGFAAACAVLIGIPALAGWISRSGGPGRRMGLVAAIVVGLWGVGEAAVRIVDARRGRGGHTAHYGPGPDLASYHRWLQEAPTPGVLQVNAERFRGPEITVAKPADTLRVFTLGGAGTFLAHLPYEETWPARLASRLAADRPRWRVEVQNASYTHWTSQHSLIWYLGRVQDFDPDLVTLMHGPMDLGLGFHSPQAGRRPFDWAYGHHYGPLAFMVKARYLPQARPNIWDHSRLFWYARRWMWFAFYDEAPAGVDDLTDPPRESRPPGPIPSLWCYERNVRTLATLVALDGRRLVLLTHPHNVRGDQADGGAIRERFGDLYRFDNGKPVDGVEFAEGLSVFNDTTRRLAAELDAGLVDLDAGMSGRGEWFADPWTLNAEGCRLAAERIAEALLPLVALEPPARAGDEEPAGKGAELIRHQDQGDRAAAGRAGGEGHEVWAGRPHRLPFSLDRAGVNP